MKRILAIFLCMAMVISGSTCVFALENFSTVDDSDVKSKISDDELLINIAADIINASREYYYVRNVRVENKNVSFKDNIYNVDYVIEMDEVLKATDAMELPQMQGIAEALKLDSNITVGEFENALAGKKLVNSLLRDKNADNDMLNEEAFAIACDGLVDFVNNIENEYIGKTYPAAVILRACFDTTGNFIKLQTQDLFGEFTDDLSITMPASYTVMKERGHDQVDDLMQKAVQLKENTSSNIVPMANTFTYKRVDAANYANTYSSNPTGHSLSLIHI